MIRRMLGLALAALLFAAPAWYEAAAQTATDQPAAPAQPAKPAAKAKTVKAKPKAEPAATTSASSLAYPPCSKTVKDSCIQLWQRDLGKLYPQCSKVKNSIDRAACIEGAAKS